MQLIGRVCIHKKYGHLLAWPHRVPIRSAVVFGVGALGLVTFFNQSLAFFLLVYTLVPLTSLCLERAYVRPRVLSLAYARASISLLGSLAVYRPFVFSPALFSRTTAKGAPYRPSYTDKPHQVFAY